MKIRKILQIKEDSVIQGSRRFRYQLLKLQSKKQLHYDKNGKIGK